MSEQGGHGPTQERRAAPRLGIQVPMEYGQYYETGHGFTKDVSLSGVRIEQASLAVPIETELRLRFSFFLGSFETLFRGEVVRRTADGFAVQFASLDEAQLEILRTALRPDASA